MMDHWYDQFNFMAYDIYGTWDAEVNDIGPYVYASTNLTMIDQGLALLWHNGIDPSQVNLGLGFYGRSMIFLCWIDYLWFAI